MMGMVTFPYLAFAITKSRKRPEVNFMDKTPYCSGRYGVQNGNLCFNDSISVIPSV